MRGKPVANVPLDRCVIEVMENIVTGGIQEKHREVSRHREMSGFVDKLRIVEEEIVLAKDQQHGRGYERADVIELHGIMHCVVF